MTEREDLVVAGCGEADQHQPELFDSRARAVIRYADPVAWTVAAAIARATRTSGGLLDAWRHDVAVVVVSDDGPVLTMAQVQTNAEAGFSSPLRYAAANPGSLAGVACIASGFRGPTLNFAMRPCDGIPVGLLVGRAWLRRGIARALVLASFGASENRGASARAVLLVPNTALPARAALDASVIDWIRQRVR